MGGLVDLEAEVGWCGRAGGRGGGGKQLWADWRMERRKQTGVAGWWTWRRREVSVGGLVEVEAEAEGGRYGRAGERGGGGRQVWAGWQCPVACKLKVIS